MKNCQRAQALWSGTVCWYLPIRSFTRIHRRFSVKLSVLVFPFLFSSCKSFARFPFEFPSCFFPAPFRKFCTDDNSGYARSQRCRAAFCVYFKISPVPIGILWCSWYYSSVSVPGLIVIFPGIKFLIPSTFIKFFAWSKGTVIGVRFMAFALESISTSHLLRPNPLSKRTFVARQTPFRWLATL